MKSYFTSKTLIIGSAILLIGAALAFAHGNGWSNGGYGGHMMGYGGGYGMGPGMMGYGNGTGGYGMGPGMMGYGNGTGGYGMGPGMMGYGWNGADNPNGNGANLSDEQRSRLEDSQQKFFNNTQGLREKIRNQRIALQDELSLDTPDAAKVAQLQKTLSKLEADYNQEAVQHQLELRKIAPDVVGYQGNGQGYGYGGHCW